MKQPCLDCGTPADTTRCTKCSGRFARGRNAAQTAGRQIRGGRPQYGAGWATLSAHVRATTTRCWICQQGPRPDDPWQADHITPAQWGAGTGQIRGAHRSCNVARGNRTRHQPPTTHPYPPTGTP